MRICKSNMSKIQCHKLFHLINQLHSKLICRLLSSVLQKNQSSRTSNQTNNIYLYITHCRKRWTYDRATKAVIDIGITTFLVGIVDIKYTKMVVIFIYTNHSLPRNNVKKTPQKILYISLILGDLILPNIIAIGIQNN